MKTSTSIALSGVALIAVASAAFFYFVGPAALRLPALIGGGTNAPTTHNTGLHKCKQGGTVVYSDAPCAAGQQAQAMGGGAVTVVPGRRPKPALPAMPASLPNARDLAGDPNQPSLRDQYIDRVVNP